MKIMHTADWHLGAKLEGRDRTDEQIAILNEMADIADRFDVSAVLVAGDVYHNSMPSAEAEDMFFDAVDRLSSNGNRLVFVLAGNHDDALRLGASRPLANKHNIIFACDDQFVDVSKVKLDGRVRIIDAGKGFIRIKSGEEEAVIAYLPFVAEGKAKELAGCDDYGQSIKILAQQGASHFSSEAFNIFVSHLFVAGGSMGEGDTVNVGQALAVAPDVMPQKAHYVALGHLHRTQKIGENIFYSGSTTSLRFKDNEPNVLIVEGDKSGALSVKTVPIKSACSLIKKKVSNIAFAYKELSYTSPNELVELTFVQSMPLKASEIKELKRQFPNLVSVRLELSGDKKVEAGVSRRELNDRDLFVEFYKHQTGSEPDERLVEMFLEIRGKADVAD